MSFALSRMLDGTSAEEALLAILCAWGNEVALMLWMLSESMVLPYRNLFMVGPNKPSGLMANGMSCILEL